MLNLIVVGAGLIGPRHCQHIFNRSDCNLLAIIDHSANGPIVSEKFGCLLFVSIDELFQYLTLNNLPYPQGAVLATPNHTHASLGLQLAIKGIHLLIEKPLSDNLTDCKTIIDYCHSQHLKLLVGHHRRFNPVIIATKQKLSQIGHPIAVQGSWCLKKNFDYYLSKPWRVSTATGGGNLLINLIHDVDLLLYLLGPIVKVYAEPLVKQREFEVDEGAVLIFSFASGCKGTFVCSDNVISPFNFESGTGENPTIPKFNDLQGFYRIFGSRGTLSVPDLTVYHQNSLNSENSVGNDSSHGSWLNPISADIHTVDTTIGNSSFFSPDTSTYLPTPNPSPNDSGFIKPPKQPFDFQLDHFLDLIRNKEVMSKCSGEDALNALLVMQTVMMSINSGKPEYVPDINTVHSNIHQYI